MRGCSTYSVLFALDAKFQQLVSMLGRDSGYSSKLVISRLFVVGPNLVADLDLFDGTGPYQ